MLAKERIEEIQAELRSQGYYLKCRPNVYAAAFRDTSLEFPPKPLAAAVRCALIGRLPDGGPPQISASGATDREAAERAFDEWQRQADDATPNDPRRRPDDDQRAAGTDSTGL
jgi:hypothetical protein